jgi:hypothetical protein
MKKYFNGFTTLYLFILIMPLAYYFFSYIPQNENYFIDRAQREIKELSLNFQELMNNSVKIHENLLSGSVLDQNYISETLDAKFIKEKFVSIEKSLIVRLNNKCELTFRQKLNNGTTLIYSKKLDFLKNSTPAFFCDLFFLDASFNSYYIKNDSKFRINNIKALLGDSLNKHKKLNSTLKKIVLADEQFLLFLYPVDNENRNINTDYIVGLMPLDEFNESVYRISNNTKLFFIVFILISLICWPILKLKFSSNYDGISKAERILIFFSIIVVVMFFTIIVMDYNYYQSENIIRDKNLKSLNELVGKNVNQELIQIDSVLTIFSRNKGKLPFTNVHQFYPDLNMPPYPRSYFILNETARQKKWSIQNKLKLSDHKILQERKYFKYFKERDFYFLEEEKRGKLRKDFFLQNLTSLSTGKDELVVAKKGESKKSDYVEAITTSLFTFNFTPLPKNYAFLIMNDEGKTIFNSSGHFHSSENFLIESGNHTILKSAISNQSETMLNLRHHGKDIRAFIKPFNSPYINQNWFVVSLYQKDRQHIINVSLVIKTVAVYIILLIALFLMKFIYLSLFVFIKSLLDKKKTGGISLYRIKEINNFISFSWLSPHSNLQSTSMFLIILNLSTFLLLITLNQLFKFTILQFLTICTLSISFIEILNYFICSIPKKELVANKFFNKKKFHHSYYQMYLWSFVILIVIFPLSSIFIQLENLIDLKQKHASHIELHEGFTKQYEHYYQRYENIKDKNTIKPFVDTQLYEQMKHNHRILESIGYSFSSIKLDSKFKSEFKKSNKITYFQRSDHELLSTFTLQKNEIIESIEEISNRTDSAKINFFLSPNKSLHSYSNIPYSDNDIILITSSKTAKSLAGVKLYSYLFFIMLFFFVIYRLIRYLINNLFIKGLVLSHSKVSKKFIYFKNEFIESKMKDFLKNDEYVSFNCSTELPETWNIESSENKIVLIENIDINNEEEKSNNAILEAVQKIIATNPRKVIIHTRLHPLVHFNLEDRYKRSWQRLFEQFDYNYLPEKIDMGLDKMNQEGKYYYERKEIISECSSFQLTQQFLWDENLKDLLFEEGIGVVKDKLYWYSYHFYKSLWDQCTIEEKVILYNYSSDEILKKQKNIHIINLINKGLLKETNYNQYDVFSENFEFFVIENFDKSVKEKFLESETSLWQTIKVPFIFLILLLAIFLFSTQRELMDQAISVVAGIAAGVPLLFNIFKIFKPMKAVVSS